MRACAMSEHEIMHANDMLCGILYYLAWYTSNCKDLIRHSYRYMSRTDVLRLGVWGTTGGGIIEPKTGCQRKSSYLWYSWVAKFPASPLHKVTQTLHLRRIGLNFVLVEESNMCCSDPFMQGVPPSCTVHTTVDMVVICNILPLQNQDLHPRIYTVTKQN